MDKGTAQGGSTPIVMSITALICMSLLPTLLVVLVLGSGSGNAGLPRLFSSSSPDSEMPYPTLLKTNIVRNTSATPSLPPEPARIHPVRGWSEVINRMAKMRDTTKMTKVLWKLELVSLDGTHVRKW